MTISATRRNAARAARAWGYKQKDRGPAVAHYRQNQPYARSFYYRAVDTCGRAVIARNT